MQFIDNSVRFLYPNFLDYMGEILLQFWNLKKNYFSFLQIMAVYIFYDIFSILHGVINSNL